MKTFFIGIYLITIFFVIVFARKSYSKKEKMGRKTGRILLCASVIVIGYTLSMWMDSYFIKSCGSSAVFIGIDFLLLAYIDYLYEYLNIGTRSGKLGLKFLFLIGLADSIVLGLNPFKEIALTYEQIPCHGMQIFRYVPFTWYQGHLMFCYILILFSILLVCVKCARTSLMYWYRYLLLLLMTIIVVSLNAVFLLARLTIDFSVLLYSLIAVMVYWITFGKIPNLFLGRIHKTMLSELDDAMILFDYEGRFIECNKAMKTLWPDMVFHYSSLTVNEFLETTGISEENKTHQLIRELGGEERIYEYKKVNLLEKQEKSKGTIYILHDITDLLHAYQKEQMAKQANEAKSQLLANVSHELRTPINAMLGMNELIGKESKDVVIQQYTKHIEDAGNNLLTLINDLLDFSKVESGRMEVVNHPYHIGSMIDEIANMMEIPAKKKGLSLEVTVNEKIPDELCGDERKIRQIIINLLTNAIKYTKTGLVALELDLDAQEESMDGQEIMLHIRVRDTGCGIQKEDRDIIFKEFQRADLNNNRSIEGNGLGLAICQNYIRLMGGTIQLDSTYGEGSVFTVNLPQQVLSVQGIGELSYSQADQQEEDMETDSIFSGVRILLVDDNKINLLVEATLLRHMSVTTVTEESAEKAIKRLREESFDLILLDHMMPGFDGVETLKVIRKEGLAEGVPIIALTANAIQGARKQYLEYGFDDYLTKPVRGQDLKRIMNRWIRKE